MLEGMDIISKTEILESPIWVNIVFLILLAIGIVIWGILVIKEGPHSQPTLLVMVIIAMLSIIWLLCGTRIFPKHTGKYEYMVRLNDSLDWSEFNNLYEIIEQEDGIYKIKEK